LFGSDFAELLVHCVAKQEPGIAVEPEIRL